MAWTMPENLRDEQRAVEAQIREAFRGVSREGGISWTEADVVDGDLSGRTREQARAEDTETAWEDLVDDAGWEHEGGLGGFVFLDAIGYRYYIAPAMIRCSRNGGGEFTGYALTIVGDYMEERVSGINQRQARAIARFVRFMIVCYRVKGVDI